MNFQVIVLPTYFFLYEKSFFCRRKKRLQRIDTRSMEMNGLKLTLVVACLWLYFLKLSFTINSQKIRLLCTIHNYISTRYIIINTWQLFKSMPDRRQNALKWQNTAIITYVEGIPFLRKH